MTSIYKIMTIDKLDRECWSKVYVNFQTCLKKAERLASRKYNRFQTVAIYRYPVGEGEIERGIV